MSPTDLTDHQLYTQKMGRALKAVRERRGLSRTKVCETLHISIHSLKSLENGKKMLSFIDIAMLIRYYEVPRAQWISWVWNVPTLD